MTWLGKLSARRRLHELGSKIIGHWKQLALTSGFARWVHMQQERREMKHKGKKVVARWARNSAMAVLLTWLQAVDDRKAEAEQQHVSHEVAALQAQHSASVRRLKEDMLKYEKAHIAGLVGLGQGTKVQQELAGSMAFFALAMWQRQTARAVKSKLQVSLSFMRKLWLSCVVY